MAWATIYGGAQKHCEDTSLSFPTSRYSEMAEKRFRVNSCPPARYVRRRLDNGTRKGEFPDANGLFRFGRWQGFCVFSTR
ncbi:unnamed protein product [Bursaphelenchus xylophilus]|uniref:(pine wood nematode) hypothetical protein n=1 Tax=Bursaphelenchus xylophilus TaxID=6326 RepID=A0A1I7SD87_BURXY|nr:unnamed protein product [Bursaphelenchus xylophilus]CAG9130540.1 unnamed protein product [Bursaphelenchus xylophilus]